MRKTRRQKSKQKYLIIGTALALILIMTTGYAVFGTDIIINAKGNVKERTNFYVSSNGSDTTGVGSKTKPYATIEKAYDKAPSSATIYIMDNINAISTTTMSSNKDIILTSYNINGEANSIIRDSSFKDNIIFQTSGALTLENIVVDGNNISGVGRILWIDSSSLNINKGTVLKNNKCTAGAGGGAIILKNNSTITMNGGTISNNKAFSGNGGAITDDGTVIMIMNGGTISNNEVSSTVSNTGSGGAIYSSNFTMNGGTISNNTAQNFGGALLCAGNCKMTNGTISNNVAGNSGGGVRVGLLKTFTMTGGTIKNNSASTDGGVSINSGAGTTFNHESGVICENKPINSFETHTNCPN